MEKDKVRVMLLATIFVRGEMLKKGAVVEVNKREAKELITREKATTDIEQSIEVHGDEDTMKPIEDMKKDELLEYAATLPNVEVDESMTKAVIIEAINASEEE